VFVTSFSISCFWKAAEQSDLKPNTHICLTQDDWHRLASEVHTRGIRKSHKYKQSSTPHKHPMHDPFLTTQLWNCYRLFWSTLSKPRQSVTSSKHFMWLSISTSEFWVSGVALGKESSGLSNTSIFLLGCSAGLTAGLIGCNCDGEDREKYVLLFTILLVQVASTRNFTAPVSWAAAFCNRGVTIVFLAFTSRDLDVIRDSKAKWERFSSCCFSVHAEDREAEHSEHF
jgi:hypothetical protein